MVALTLPNYLRPSSIVYVEGIPVAVRQANITPKTEPRKASWLLDSFVTEPYSDQLYVGQLVVHVMPADLRRFYLAIAAKVGFVDVVINNTAINFFTEEITTDMDGAEAILSVVQYKVP